MRHSPRYGKTTYRKLAEAALAEIEGLFDRRGASWTRKAPLPGGDFPVNGFADLVEGLRRDFPILEPAHAQRLARLYGTLARDILAEAKSAADLGLCFGADLCEAEVRCLIAREWAMSAEDVLWRRTKCGLRLSKTEAEALDAYIVTGRKSDNVAAE